MDVKRVLFISNGHGEDLIAARIAGTLKASKPDLPITALPIVGLGTAYTAMDIPLIMEGKNLPSGGFIRNGLKYLLMDLKGGIIDLTRSQIRKLKEEKNEIDLVICVGDLLVVYLAGKYLKKPIVFLPTAKSDYIEPHGNIEIHLMRRFCNLIFPRDEFTAKSMDKKGLPANYLGNVMMDCLDFIGPELNGLEEEWVIGVLPGSRYEVYLNMEDIAPIIIEFQKLITAQKYQKNIRCLIALSNGLSPFEIGNRLQVQGWTFIPASLEEADRGIKGFIVNKSFEPSVKMTVTQNRFADVLEASNVIIGLAGTANEQAVGLGKPVVTFVGRGSQFTEKFVRTQKKLLGDSILVVKRDPRLVASAILKILSDPEQQRIMAKIGRERMGEPGAVKRIVSAIQKML